MNLLSAARNAIKMINTSVEKTDRDIIYLKIFHDYILLKRIEECLYSSPEAIGGAGSGREETIIVEEKKSHFSLSLKQAELVSKAQGQLNTPSTPHAPICDQCGIQMVERTRRDDGGKFYGCVNYPACEVTEQHEDDDGGDHSFYGMEYPHHNS